jgi:hypothetical protein
MPSSIPAARAHLFSLLTTAFAGQTNVQVYYGKTLGTFVAPLTVQIMGWAGDQQPAELGPSYRREETFAIQCQINSWAGDQLYANRETEVMAAFGTVSVIVANNYTLPSTAGGNDGAVRFAEVGTFSFTPEADDMGKSMGILNFDVHCSARIASLT